MRQKEILVSEGGKRQWGGANKVKELRREFSKLDRVADFVLSPTGKLREEPVVSQAVHEIRGWISLENIRGRGGWIQEKKKSGAPLPPSLPPGRPDWGDWYR